MLVHHPNSLAENARGHSVMMFGDEAIGREGGCESEPLLDGMGTAASSEQI